MPATVLVAHASRHGSTREVAEAVAQALRDCGVEVDVQAAHDVRTPEPYGAVVLGGAIYTGRWHHDARHLLHQHRHAFARTPVAVFGMGPRTLDAEGVADSRRVIEAALDEVPAVDARDWDAIRDWAQRLPDRLGLAAVGAAR